MDTPALVCFSHLRWSFVFQRPQHLLTRCARERRVFYVEEPVFDGDSPGLSVTSDPSSVTIVTPRLPGGLSGAAIHRELRWLVDRLFSLYALDPYMLWYYTPMALPFSYHLRPLAMVYDCMDELSGFAGAPSGIRDAERALIARADVMFTGGQSLFEAKRHLHPNVHAFPSSVDVAHFARARMPGAEPADQAAIPGPRMGFFGVLDERLDLDLLAAAAARRPHWHFVLLGPVVKIDPASLPQAPNLHYLGPKGYADLPDYIRGWDVALLPFARNDATRFISPTKTPEYLAAGRPVVSTSIRDVVRPYGELGLARIADDPAAFVAAIDAARGEPPAERLAAADRLLSRMSWDGTWAGMSALIAEVASPSAPTRRTVATRVVVPPPSTEPVTQPPA